MAGTIVVDRIESDASYTSTINVANRITFSNTVNFGVFAGTAPVAGFYLPTTNNLAFTTASTERMRIDSSGNVGIGTTSPTAKLAITNSNATYSLSQRIFNASAGNLWIGQAPAATYFSVDNFAMAFCTNSDGGVAGTSIPTNERMRIDSSGNLGIGTTTPDIFSRGYGKTVGINDTGSSGAVLQINSASGYSAVELGRGGARKAIFTAQSTVTEIGNLEAVPLTFLTNSTERMRLDSSGNAFFGGNFTVSYPGNANTTTGIFLESSGQLSVSRANTLVARFNRNTSDGTLLSFLREGTEIGTVSVSGGTVSYNAFAGSHWSQLSDGSKPDILRGTVLDSINEFVQWPDEPTTERLCKVKVSDTAGSKKVYGVFMDWDNDWTATNDMYVTAVGAFICRVNASVTVQEGDLLESNGDGTARVQSDDLIRSSTIGKVTCTEKTHQYDDGSYCVPTVLYCG